MAFLASQSTSLDRCAALINGSDQRVLLETDCILWARNGEQFDHEFDYV